MSRGRGGKGLGKVKTLKVDSTIVRRYPKEQFRKTLAQTMRELEEAGVFEVWADLDDQARLQAEVDQFMWPGRDAWDLMSEDERKELRNLSE